MVAGLIAELFPVILGYRFPFILAVLTVGFIIYRYIRPQSSVSAVTKAKNKIIQDADGDFVPLPPGADDEERITQRQSSMNADAEDMTMRKYDKRKGGWKALPHSSWSQSELIPPKSRRWDGL
tara:strand:- start:38 stop:406 length:369 start_codon:yes stop_codon:yes gene_type:complete